MMPHEVLRNDVHFPNGSLDGIKELLPGTHLQFRSDPRPNSPSTRTRTRISTRTSITTAHNNKTAFSQSCTSEVPEVH